MTEIDCDFHKGDRVVYVPSHANGDRFHSDCEHGKVVTTSEMYVFVLFDNDIDPERAISTAKACKRENLELE